jgi:hypothetical protein
MGGGGGRVRVQNKIMDVRASNAGDAYNDQLYSPTPPMVSQKQDFIEVQLWHQGIGERGENIKMINEGIKGEVDEFGFAQRITQPFIAQALADKKQVMDTEKEIESDLITKGKLEFLRRQGLLLEPERQGTFLPSGRGLQRPIPLSTEVLRQDVKMLEQPSDRPIEAGETSMLTQEEQRRRELRELRKLKQEEQKEIKELRKESRIIKEKMIKGEITMEDIFGSDVEIDGDPEGLYETSLSGASSSVPPWIVEERTDPDPSNPVPAWLRGARQVGRREQPSFPPSQERLDEARRILQREERRFTIDDPSYM